MTVEKTVSIEVPKTGTIDSAARNFICLPATERYPDLLVAKQTVYKPGTVDKLNDSLKKKNHFILPPYIWSDFFGFLMSDEPFYDGSGDTIQLNERLALRATLLGKQRRNGEYIDARFLVGRSGTLIKFHRLVAGSLEEVTENLDPDTLMEDTPIHLTSWLKNRTSQGLPRKDAKKGSMRYAHPREGYALGFEAHTSAVNFDGGQSPNSVYSALSLRIARIK